jgi:hypothetical protein
MPHPSVRSLSMSEMQQSVIWRSPEGKIIACVEKNKVLQENLAEIRQVCRDALEDAVLMGCDEQQFLMVLADLVAQLKNPYPPRE